METSVHIVTTTLAFLKANQVLLSIVALCVTFVIKEFILYKAKANPAIDIWDALAPGSSQLSEVVHAGIEAWGAPTGETGTTKLNHALKVIQEFIVTWNTEGKAPAILKLQLWFFSMKAKNALTKPKAYPNPSADPAVVTKDTPAQPADAGSIL